jgi:hypothetical protein
MAGQEHLRWRACLRTTFTSCTAMCSRLVAFFLGDEGGYIGQYKYTLILPRVNWKGNISLLKCPI